MTTIQLSSGKTLREDVFRLYGAQYKLTQLTPGEQAAFKSNFNLLGTQDSVERMILNERKDLIEISVMAIKNSLNDPLFAGMSPSDSELGMQLIRPGHVGFNTTETWVLAASSSTAYTDWVGSSGTPHKVGGTTTDTSKGEAGLCWCYVRDFATNPIVRELKLKVNREEHVVDDIRAISLGDNVNQVPILPIGFGLALPKDELYFKFKTDVASGAIELALGGVCIGLGKHLKNENYD